MWEGIKEWDSNSYFNYEDINRIENNTLEIYNLALILRELFNLDNVKTDHDIKTIPFDDLLNKIERNINTLGLQVYKPSDWNVLDADWIYDTPFSYQDINKWEQNLLMLYKYIKGNVDKLPYCGQVYIGEEVI